MSDSKTSPRTESANAIAPERVDQAHRLWGNQPHVQFGPSRPGESGSTGRSGTGWGQRAADSAPSPADPGLPTKLQLKMDRLLADLAALDEPEAEVLALPSQPASTDARAAEAVRQPALEDGVEDNHQADFPAVDGLRVVDYPDPPMPAPGLAAAVPRGGEAEAGEAGFGEAGFGEVVPLAPGSAAVVLTGDAVDLEADPALLLEASGAFSRQAREILDILKRRQEQLSYQKTELELREAALEKQLRQERLALVERQRQLQELESQASAAGSNAESTRWPAVWSGGNPVANATNASAEQESAGVETRQNAGRANAAPDAMRGDRRVTPEWIAARERQLHAAGWEVEALPESVGGSVEASRDSAAAAGLIEGCEENQDADFYAVIEEYVHRQVQQESGTAARRATPSQSEGLAAALPGDVTVKSMAAGQAAGLQRQAQQLRQQHATAIQAMQQTRRQLELLKDILVQQQQHWAGEVDRLASEQQAWQETRAWQQQQWAVGLEEIERLRAIEQNESAKRATFLDQREAAIQALEERLQQAQVEILRDRVVLKQLERTVRQTLSNADWNQRWQIISEETQGYLKKVHQDAETLQAAAKRKLERLESRQSEMLLYRESLRNWIERQMKLVSRRVAHGEDRQQSLQTQWEALQVARQELRAQQATLNQWLSTGLQVVDQRLQSPPPYRSDQEAA